jgi:putative transcriptional regulator
MCKVNAIEAGKYSPTLALGMKIAKAFDKPVDEIFQLEEGDQPRASQLQKTHH